MMAPSPCLMPAHPPQRRRLSPSPSVSLDAWHGMAWLDVRRILATRWPRPPRGRSTPHQQGGTHGAQAATQWAAVRWPASRRHHQHMPRTQQCLFPASRGRQRLGRGSQTSRGAHVPRNPMAGVRPSGAPNSRAISSERRGSLVPPALADGHFLLDRYGLSDQQWGRPRLTTAPWIKDTGVTGACPTRGRQDVQVVEVRRRCRNTTVVREGLSRPRRERHLGALS